jgi:hypothetical protein
MLHIDFINLPDLELLPSTSNINHMAHFAELDDNNIVLRVIVVNNNELLVDGVESEQKGISFCTELFGGNWVQTSYNNNFRGKYAGVGDKYDKDLDVFVRISQDQFSNSPPLVE